jgi:PHP family Zn ribbon phosphoesterase
MELADREKPHFRDESPEVFSLIPLPQILGELIGTGAASKGVMELYSHSIECFGSEFKLLLHTPLSEISHVSPALGEAVGRMRAGKVIRKSGFDGEYGVIRVFEEEEVVRLCGQASLFGDFTPARKGRSRSRIDNVY